MYATIYSDLGVELLSEEKVVLCKEIILENYKYTGILDGRSKFNSTSYRSEDKLATKNVQLHQRCRIS